MRSEDEIDRYLEEVGRLPLNPERVAERERWVEQTVEWLYDAYGDDSFPSPANKAKSLAEDLWDAREQLERYREAIQYLHDKLGDGDDYEFEHFGDIRRYLGDLLRDPAPQEGKR